MAAFLEIIFSIANWSCAIETDPQYIDHGYFVV